VKEIRQKNDVETSQCNNAQSAPLCHALTCLPCVALQVINNNLNPTWRPFQASMAQLCNCDPQRPLLLEVGGREGVVGWGGDSLQEGRVLRLLLHILIHLVPHTPPT